MFAPSPVGSNVRANATRYQVIAAAFARAIGRFPGHRSSAPLGVDVQEHAEDGQRGWRSYSAVVGSFPAAASFP